MAFTWKSLCPCPSPLHVPDTPQAHLSGPQLRSTLSRELFCPDSCLVTDQRQGEIGPLFSRRWLWTWSWIRVLPLRATFSSGCSEDGCKLCQGQTARPPALGDSRNCSYANGIIRVHAGGFLQLLLLTASLYYPSLGCFQCLSDSHRNKGKRCFEF